ncbi:MULTISPECIES: sensor histidine kinase [Mucilaginibacter]|uniref:histidine kinase n=1 Tax=Mucilaginibacter rubeus TaxID=2027860 RepID=A0ABX7UPV7_9SPHI|nr:MULTISPECIES: ATP-binding protein [Mucilaginibacter]QTE46654.1 ATP-binding protein [Mucilaginibacter rubeus]QTE53251.1 ATP-binding protein [Mucilaginibacter rubeus]QTE58338.1 ATP-binding protein [Mucilaginibacter rubeus]QTE62203.1 ATP-binding protein [Mucilaginibacter rubeus]QTF60960.1 ATP-binding protein [Mucilaginibacter rubeus]
MFGHKGSHAKQSQATDKDCQPGKEGGQPAYVLLVTKFSSVGSVDKSILKGLLGIKTFKYTLVICYSSTGTHLWVNTQLYRTPGIIIKKVNTWLHLRDNGKGIPEEAQSKIFNKYTSYTTFGTASEKGSGLELLLCKEFVERNNGTIRFESKARIGSTFYFTVPIENEELVAL